VVTVVLEHRRETSGSASASSRAPPPWRTGRIASVSVPRSGWAYRSRCMGTGISSSPPEIERPSN
jgi:hypothetical protein